METPLFSSWAYSYFGATSMPIGDMNCNLKGRIESWPDMLAKGCRKHGPRLH
jgi:hypothetical protein